MRVGLGAGLAQGPHPSVDRLVLHSETEMSSGRNMSSL